MAFSRLQYSGVEELVEALNLLLTEASAGEGEAGLTDVVRVMPFVRLNSVMVITPRAHYLDRMETWIERLDRAPENGARTQPVCLPRTKHHGGTPGNAIEQYLLGGRSGPTSAMDNRKTRPGLNRVIAAGG